MADPLPKIQVTDAQNLGDPLGTTTSPTIDGRPRSATSSEGNVDELFPMEAITSDRTNAAQNGRKSPIRLKRNTSSKDTNGAEIKAQPPARAATTPLISTSIDPLSHHILNRTNTENTIPQKLRGTATPESPTVDLASPGSVENGNVQPEFLRSDSNPLKEKKKGVSFLSRFSIIGGKKKDQMDDVDDNESEFGDQQRTEGTNAHVFSSSIGANGYIPQHKEPPRYIKVRAHNKKTREFNRMFLAQELSGTKHDVSDDKVPGLTTTEEVQPHKLSKSPKKSGAVWTADFSRDGKYLAAAGRDQVVRVWAVISTPEERRAHEYDEDVRSSTEGGERLSAPVFRSKPVREFEGHTGDILDLSWSKNNFLLSSSMDKTVRLWHISRQECLCTFKHKDFVTSIAFHPRDDRFFLAGSLDCVLRLWSIPDKSVAFWNQLPDLITAVAFTPDGKTAMAGVLSGLCLFYDTEGLKYNTQIHVRSSRGKNAKGSKITGIRCMSLPPDAPEGEAEMKILITSNDSRVRMYSLRDKSLEMKFRGHENMSSQISASFSDDGKYIICGSEDHKAYIWSTGPIEAENKDKRPLEFFEAHTDMVTAAIIAPTKSRQLLSASLDPIYDLCNPPPVTLLSREESHASSMPPTTNTSDKRNSDTISEKPEVSPAYLARSVHADGLILVTADYVGNIKVFRQDCAHQKRRQESWETGSNFSKKMLGRSNSIMTRHSTGSHSRRASISQGTNASPQMPSDHILSWRNDITASNSRENSIRNVSLRHDGLKSTRDDRSISPGKKSRPATAQNNHASSARQNPYVNSSPVNATSSMSVSTTSPPRSVYKSKGNTSNPVTQPPMPSFTLQSANDDTGLRLDSSGKSFWSMQSWKKPSVSSTDSGLKPPLQRGGSVASNLTSDNSEPGDESEGEALSCKKCGGKDFRARKSSGKGQKLVCTKCGTTAE